MPSKTPKQAKFMAACAHGAGYDSCPPSKVSKEFNQADTGTGILERRHVKPHDGRRRHVKGFNKTLADQ